MGGVSVERSDPFTPQKSHICSSPPTDSGCFCVGGVSGERRDPFGSPTRAAENECGEHRELSSDPFTPQKEMHQLQSHRGRNVTSGWGERGAGSGVPRSRRPHKRTSRE